MHFIVVLLTLLGAFFYAYRQFHESGAATSLNPFLWKRRRDWQKREGQNPLFALDGTKDVAAALMFKIAKLDGEITLESKTALLSDYQRMLNMSLEEAQGELKQMSFILEQYPIVRCELSKILHKKILAEFSPEQVASLLNSLVVIASRDGKISSEQQQWIDDINSLLSKVQNTQVF